MAPPLYAHIAAFSFIIPLMVGAWTVRKLGVEGKMLFVFIVVTSVETIAQRYLGSQHINNHWMTHISTLFEFTVFIYIFLLSAPSPSKKKVLRTVIGAFALVWLAAKLSGLEPWDRFDSYTRPLSKAVLIVVAGSALMRETMKDGIVLPRNHVFWLSAGVLIYCSCSLIVSSLANYFVSLPKEVFDTVWTMNWTGSIVSNVMFGAMLFCNQRQ